VLALNIYCMIGLNRAPALSELQPEAVEARLRAGKKTPHLEAYIAWFNRLSQLIASSICVLKKKKKRVKVIGRRTAVIWFNLCRLSLEIIRTSYFSLNLDRQYL
jgi:hypothetical protein